MSLESFKLGNHWEEFTVWLLERTEKFPQRVRATFVYRIDNLALEVMEQLVVAYYAPRRGRAELLRGINLSLERLRILLRLAHRRALLAHGHHVRAQECLLEAGRMLGGWLRSLEGKDHG